MLGMSDNNQELFEGTFNLEEQRKEEEIDNTPVPPELPIKYFKYISHEQVYKTLSTVGDIKCFVWFQNDFYDADRDNGQHKIVIRGTFVENTADADNELIDKFVGHSSGKIVFVDCIFRDNGVDFKSNRDLRDCARWISTVAGKYDGDKNEIYILDRDDETMHHVNINEEDLSMSVDTKTSSFSLTCPRSQMRNGEKISDLSPELQSALAEDNGISSNELSNFSSFDIGGGEVILTYIGKFNSGQINWNEIQNALGGSNPVRISEYYRGKAVVDITVNNDVPKSGTIKASNFRDVAVGGVYACNGNFAHLNARWQIVNNETIWTNANFKKRIRITGHCGSLSQSQPAFRWNNSSAGENELRVNGKVIGFAGDPGSENGGGGQAGGHSMHVASFLELRSDDFSNRIRGAGGGGGGGGRGGDGGGGGHGSVKKCSGYFCWGSKTECERNGGKGGEGGNGGRGGSGKGYRWTGSSWNQQGRNDYKEGGQGGKGGSSRGGGNGGSGGGGGQGGDFCKNGDGGGKGQEGENGRGEESGCGFRGDRNGRSGQNGGGGGGFGNFTTSHSGGFSLI